MFAESWPSHSYGKIIVKLRKNRKTSITGLGLFLARKHDEVVQRRAWITFEICALELLWVVAGDWPNLLSWGSQFRWIPLWGQRKHLLLRCGKQTPICINKLMKGSLRYGSGLWTAALEAQGCALLCWLCSEIRLWQRNGGDNVLILQKLGL